MSIEDQFDGNADFNTPIYGQDSAKGEKVLRYRNDALAVPMQANPTGPFQEIYDTETKGQERGWEVLILDPAFALSVNMQIVLHDNGHGGYNNQNLAIKSWERFGNPGSTIPIYVAIQATEYQNI